MREKLLEYVEAKIFQEYLDPNSDLYKPALAEAFQGLGEGGTDGGPAETPAGKRRRHADGATPGSATKRSKAAVKAAVTRRQKAIIAVAAALACRRLPNADNNA